MDEVVAWQEREGVACFSKTNVFLGGRAYNTSPAPPTRSRAGEATHPSPPERCTSCCSLRERSNCSSSISFLDRTREGADVAIVSSVAELAAHSISRENGGLVHSRFALLPLAPLTPSVPFLDCVVMQGCGSSAPPPPSVLRVNEKPDAGQVAFKVL